MERTYAKSQQTRFLSEADQSRILTHCEHNYYEDVVKILARPRRDGGLDFQTSASALCRFVTRHHVEAQGVEEARRLDAWINEQSKGDPSLVPKAILGFVQRRILTELATDTPLPELDSAFRLMLNLQKEARSASITTFLSDTTQDPCLSGDYSPDSPRDSASFNNSGKI
jgi:hypothetical protein